MKYIFNLIIILAIGFFFYGCEKDENGRIPDNVKDANTGVLIINKAETDPFINLSNPADFKVSATVDLLFKGEFSKIDIVIVYNNDYKNQYVVKSVTTVPSNILITGQDIINAVTSLNSADDIEEGDMFNLFTNIELKDGTYLPGYNQLGSIALAPSLRNIMDGLKGAVANFVINVPCEFVLDDYLGTAIITETWAPDVEETEGEVYLDPDYTGQYIGLIFEPVMFMYGYSWKLKIELSTYDYTIKGNPEKQILGDALFSYTNPYYTKITGSVNTCTGVIRVEVGSFCIDQGCFGGMPLVYTIKKKEDSGKKSIKTFTDYAKCLRSFNRIPQ